MLGSQSLRKPEHWQDFEKLCKKLWGEIWNCREIKRNGRQGQKQNGVDIYGFPEGEAQCYGIQCKGKDDYTNAQLTKQEIDLEIAKAENFKPALKKLYFATTANKDVDIEGYMLEKNEERMAAGLFEVHLYCWEDIVDLIDENRQTHDWYVNNQKYKSTKKVSVTFEDGSTEKEATVQFKRVDTSYEFSDEKIVPPYLNNHNVQKAQMPYYTRVRVEQQNNKPPIDIKDNLSYTPISFMILNLGDTSLKDIKVLFDIEGNMGDIKLRDSSFGDTISKSGFPNCDIIIEASKRSGRIIPIESQLVGGDSVISKIIYLLPIGESSELIVKWQLLSYDYREAGELKLKINSNISIDEKTVLVNDQQKVRFKKGHLDHYLQIPKLNHNHFIN